MFKTRNAGCVLRFKRKRKSQTRKSMKINVICTVLDVSSHATSVFLSHLGHPHTPPVYQWTPPPQCCSIVYLSNIHCLHQ